MADIIEMPKLSDTMTVGTLVKWLKKEGDKVSNGDMLAEVETDKATMELECFFDGVILKIFAEAGSQVALGEPLCAVGKEGETVEAPAKKPAAPEAKKEEPKKAEQPKPEPKPAAAPTPAPAPQPARASGDRVKISPLAKKLAVEKGIDPSLVNGSGPGGRIVRADILAAEKAGTGKIGSVKAGGAAFAGGALAAKGPIQEERSVTVSTMRSVIAKRLIESKTTIPHFYLEIEVDVAPLLALREQLNTGLADAGVRLSVNDFILKASAEALRKVPDVNASWETTEIKYHPDAHVSFAVALPDGLITPVVTNAHEKSVFEISKEAKSLGRKAKDKKLTPAEFTGGTFCVSNLGMMGIPKFLPIINPPNAAILGVGTTVVKPVVKNDQIVIGQTMVLALSCDHRVVDGAVGAQFLGALKALIESPALLLV